jgi:streptomycin 6-kinase
MLGVQVDVPDALAATAARTWGAAGARWARQLPATVAGLARTWDLEVGGAFSLSHHWVAAATLTDGTSAVLKVGLPRPDFPAREAAALAAFSGRGAVRLLRADLDRGALLLERVVPGTPATALVPRRDTEATAAAVDAARRLHVPVPPGCPLPDLAGRLAALAAHLERHPAGAPQPVPRDLVERAQRLSADLLASAPRQVVLHGDLHHDNLLHEVGHGQDRWLVIDPHGLVGDPGYEAGAWLYNPLGQVPGLDVEVLLRLLPLRLEQLSDGLGEPPGRIAAWCFTQAALSLVWDAEDGGTPQPGVLAVARALARRVP